MTDTTSSPMVSVFDGRDCLGFILSRGKAGFQAITADDRELGLFWSQQEAADALSQTQRLCSRGCSTP
jgi:hypothetical protein